ncbi:2Fe-2S iron-sulfur cluster binding domain-containing protein [archaeon]|nr:MAG: 2Fe-2S iron-sulfur cluster binding domain-containing protein [archaeon]
MTGKMELEMIFSAVFLFTFILGAVMWWRKSLKKLFRKFVSASKVDEDIELQEQRNPLISPDRGTSLHSSIPWSNVLRFTLNGKEIEVVNPDPSELLAGFIRDKMFLKGTKLGCQEGGCGACTVMLEKADGTVVSANSCLRLLCANDGMSLTTVEGIGSLQGGLSVEQQSMVDHNGTQCGFCTPGWITAMHSLREEADRIGQPLQSGDIDKKFDGNICRCTGYRPIMAAFHSLCDDARKGHCGPQEAADCQVKYKDIEDIRACSHAQRNLNLLPTPSTTLTNRHHGGASGTAKRSMKLRSDPQPLLFVSYTTGKKFYRPLTLPQLCAIVGEYQASPQAIKLVSGNTSIGVTKYLNNTEPFYVADDFPVMVDVNMVPELHVKTYAATGELTIGAAVSLTDVISTLKTHAKSTGRGDGVPIAEGVSASSVFAVTAYHLEKVANTQVCTVNSLISCFFCCFANIKYYTMV